MNIAEIEATLKGAMDHMRELNGYATACREMLRKHEWSDYDGLGMCQECRATTPSPHEPGCEWAALIK